MKKLLFIVAVFAETTSISAQDKQFTKTGKITFDATVPKSPENIDAVNKSVVCVLDIKAGALQFAVLMKGFEFDRALMMEHFNENYVESNKYPKADFKGTISNNAAVNYTRDGVYPVKVKGKLTMHGETKDVEADGKITIKAGKITAAADFEVLFKDYKIDIPELVADKVSKTARIKVDCSLEPLKQ
ncbi:MAG: YceI family protein [Chitinophagaceae bacterium]|nr:YceI family protein [Chitinophagaceae bacterium]